MIACFENGSVATIEGPDSPPKELFNAGAEVQSVVQSADGRMLLVTSKELTGRDHLALWDLESARTILSVSGVPVDGVFFTPDASSIVGTVGSNVLVWNTQRGGDCKVFGGFDSKTEDVLFGGRGDRAVAIGWTTRLISLGAPLVSPGLTLETTPSVRAVVRGGTALLAGDAYEPPRLFDLNRPADPSPPIRRPLMSGFSEHGATFTSREGQPPYRLKLSFDAPEEEVPLPSDLMSKLPKEDTYPIWAKSDDGKFFALRERDQLVIYDLPSNRERWRTSIPGTQVGQVFSPSGRFVAVASSTDQRSGERAKKSREVRIFSTEDGSALPTEPSTESIRFVSWSPDETRIAVLCESTCQVRDVRTGSLVIDLPHTGRTAGFSEDGTILAIGYQRYMTSCDAVPYKYRYQARQAQKSGGDPAAIIDGWRRSSGFGQLQGTTPRSP
ncbi:MAG: WD40 repeat domain-containing protein [Phycisphaerales bacterium]